MKIDKLTRKQYRRSTLVSDDVGVFTRFYPHYAVGLSAYADDGTGFEVRFDRRDLPALLDLVERLQ